MPLMLCPCCSHFAHSTHALPVPESGMGEVQAAWESVGRASASGTKHDTRSAGGGIGSTGGMLQLST